MRRTGRCPPWPTRTRRGTRGRRIRWLLRARARGSTREAPAMSATPAAQVDRSPPGWRRPRTSAEARPPGRRERGPRTRTRCHSRGRGYRWRLQGRGIGFHDARRPEFQVPTRRRHPRTGPGCWLRALSPGRRVCHRGVPGGSPPRAQGGVRGSNSAPTPAHRPEMLAAGPLTRAAGVPSGGSRGVAPPHVTALLCGGTGGLDRAAISRPGRSTRDDLRAPPC